MKQFENGLLISEVKDNGIIYNYEYDTNKNLTKVIRADNYIENYTYDTNNNQISYTNSEN